MTNFSFKRVFTTVKNNFIINKSIPLLTFIITAIVMFLVTTLPISNAESRFIAPVIDYERYSWYLEDMEATWNSIIGINGFQTTFAIILSIGIAFLSTVTLTAYSRDKKGLDFWNSQSLLRQEHILANLISSILYFVISIVPSMFLSLVIAFISSTYKPLDFGKIILSQLPSLLFIILFYISVLAVAYLAFMLAGSILSGLVFYGTMLAYPALTLFASAQISSYVFHTNFAEMFSHNYTPFVYSSPALRYFMSFLDVYRLQAFDYILYAVFALVVLALVFWLAPKRKNELAQNAVVFPVLRYPIQYIWTFIFTLFLAWFLYAINSTPIWFALGSVLGLLISFIALNIVFERSFNNIFKKSIHLFITGGIYIVIVLVFIADIFTIYKAPVPDFDKIERFSIYINESYSDDMGEYNEHLDVFSSYNEIDDSHREIIKNIYNYIENTRGNDYTNEKIYADKYEKVETTSPKSYSVSLNFTCDDDPNSWYSHLFTYTISDEFFDMIDKLMLDFESHRNTNYYPFEKTEFE